MDQIKKFKLLNALPLIIESWNTVSVDTIINCFSHAYTNWECKNNYMKCENANISMKNAIIYKNLIEFNNDIAFYDILPICDDNYCQDDIFLENIFISNDSDDIEELKNKTNKTELIGFAGALYHIEKLELFFLQSNGKDVKQLSALRQNLFEMKKKSVKITDYFLKNINN
ncbi:hypothetical protein A3Q56_05549 [Intoshia linei]|uniref:Uncharacterized protein n=1 Tax=Intoshia linei TaxID=1819745 RepID=A0A177AZZ3_9BILA|nr:hypothetical protein A3Q56_05549 [Intoshia linei]